MLFFWRSSTQPISYQLMSCLAFARNGNVDLDPWFGLSQTVVRLPLAFTISNPCALAPRTPVLGYPVAWSVNECSSLARPDLPAQHSSTRRRVQVPPCLTCSAQIFHVWNPTQHIRVKLRLGGWRLVNIVMMIDSS